MKSVAECPSEDFVWAGATAYFLPDSRYCPFSDVYGFTRTAWRIGDWEEILLRADQPVRSMTRREAVKLGLLD